MILRISLTAILFIFIFSMSCGGPADSDADTENGQTPTPAYERPRDTGEAEDVIPDHKIATVSEIMRLEGEFNETGDPELISDLVTAHEMYVHLIANERGIAPLDLNKVMFSHYSRILELDGSNVEAEAGLNGVRAWYETHAMTLPSEVNPIDCLPGHMPEVEEQEVEEQEVEPEETE